MLDAGLITNEEYNLKKKEILSGNVITIILSMSGGIYYIGSAEGHEYPDLQVGDEGNPRQVFIFCMCLAAQESIYRYRFLLQEA